MLEDDNHCVNGIYAYLRLGTLSSNPKKVFRLDTWFFCQQPNYNWNWKETAPMQPRAVLRDFQLNYKWFRICFAASEQFTFICYWRWLEINEILLLGTSRQVPFHFNWGLIWSGMLQSSFHPFPIKTNNQEPIRMDSVFFLIFHYNPSPIRPECGSLL